MKKIINTLFFISLAILGGSCTKSIYLDLNEEKDNLVAPKKSISRFRFREKISSIRCIRSEVGL